MVIDDNTIECWIPSTEGTNFQIWWKAEKNARIGLDLWCNLYLDGIQHQCSFLLAKDIAEEGIGRKRGQPYGDSLIRLYCFGKRKLTDDETIVPLNSVLQTDLNTIQTMLSWGNTSPPRPWAPPKILEAKPIHEKMAKKGHSGSAELGKLVLDPSHPVVSRSFNPIPGSEPVAFVFRYASQDWLQTRGIIPPTQKSEDSASSEADPTKKRARSATPDVVDIDDLESDDDEIVIVKHLVPIPTSSNKRPRKVKDEGDVQSKLEL